MNIEQYLEWDSKICYTVNDAREIVNKKKAFWKEFHQKYRRYANKLRKEGIYLSRMNPKDATKIVFTLDKLERVEEQLRCVSVA